MKTSRSLIAFSAFAALSLPGRALADRSYPERPDDLAGTAPPMMDRTTRADVFAARQQFRANPITEEGRRNPVGGEVGWIGDDDEHTRTN